MYLFFLLIVITDRKSLRPLHANQQTIAQVGCLNTALSAELGEKHLFCKSSFGHGIVSKEVFRIPLIINFPGRRPEIRMGAFSSIGLKHILESPLIEGRAAGLFSDSFGKTAAEAEFIWRKAFEKNRLEMKHISG